MVGTKYNSGFHEANKTAFQGFWVHRPLRGGHSLIGLHAGKSVLKNRLLFKRHLFGTSRNTN